MAIPEGAIKAGLRNEEAAITSTLRPGAMVATPLLTTALLPSGVRLPRTVHRPSPLLLPRGRLHLGPLRLCGQLQTLCLLRLLCRLGLPPALGLRRRLSLRFGVALGLRLSLRLRRSRGPRTLLGLWLLRLFNRAFCRMLWRLPWLSWLDLLPRRLCQVAPVVAALLSQVERAAAVLLVSAAFQAAYLGLPSVPERTKG